MRKILEAKGIRKKFRNGNVDTHVLKGIDLSVEEGEFLSIMGRSGAGKSTLLYQLSLLDTPTTGEIYINNQDVLKLSSKEKTAFRLNHMGYVFQDYALVPELTAIENVSLPLLMRGISITDSKIVAKKVFADLGLTGHENNLPSQLSGGEQQRVSIARAIVDEPQIIFTDEPTANLDSESARVVIDLLKSLNKKGQTIIMVTHEQEYGNETDRIIYLAEGYIQKEKRFR
jgi:putative ABC transport system ATP-binding protein